MKKLHIFTEHCAFEDRRPTSLTVTWDGFPREVKTKNLDGYVLEYSLGGPNRWIQHNDILPLKGRRGALYRETVWAVYIIIEIFPIIL